MSDSPEIKAWTSAYLVAISLQSTFPHAQEIQVELIGNYLAVRCKLPFTLQKDFFALIEEKIRFFAKSHEPILQKEMVPVSAAGYFKAKGVYELFKEVADLPLIQFFEYDDLITLCDQPLSDSFFGLSHIKLVDLIAHSSETYTLIAAVGEDKQELKECVKKYQKAKEKNHLLLGEKLKLFVLSEEGVFWLPKGLQLRQKIANEICKLHEESQFIRIEAPPEMTLQEAHQFLREEADSMKRVFSLQRKFFPIEFLEEKGLLDYPSVMQMVSSIFCSRKEIEKECISSLLFAQKISTILQFCGSYVLFCPTKMKTSLWETALRQVNIPYERRKAQGNIPKIEYQVKDGLGRSWPLFSLELESISEELCHIVCCNLPSLERITALMLENEQITG